MQHISEPNQERKIRLERWKQSGKTIAQFCRDENTPYHTFLYWHKKLIGTKQAKYFVKFNFSDSNARPNLCEVVFLNVNRIIFSSAPDALFLKQLIG
jgi:hypothetical protein